jgi:tetrapyrrole methylase family protein / MazG family protein
MPAGITIVGLGPGRRNDLTREAEQVLESAAEIWARTARHPTIAEWPELLWESFDSFYESADAFDTVYQKITEQVLRLGARPQGVVYAVPGNPWVGESTVTHILSEAKQAGLPVRVIQGLSFVEPVLALLGVDALDGLFVADAMTLAKRHHPNFPPSAHVLAAQLFSVDLATDVKLTLMNQYTEEHPVRLVHAAGTQAEMVEDLPLHAMDRSKHIAHLTTLYIPPLVSSSLEDFQETIAHLRAPEGCPWDREQTHQSIRGNLLEETYETLEALDLDDAEKMREEFGDLLLQILLHTQIATEAGEFRMADVIHGIETKIRRRHPHVFGEINVTGAGQVLQNWEKIKEEERKENPVEEKGRFDGIPITLPALEQADVYQQRAARVGFDWPDISGVKAKVQEELDEIESAATDEERAWEVGDALFAVVNLARWLKVEPEAALRVANTRFRDRFHSMENSAASIGKPLSQLSLAEWDALWEAAKQKPASKE